MQELKASLAALFTAFIRHSLSERLKFTGTTLTGTAKEEKVLYITADSISTDLNKSDKMAY